MNMSKATQLTNKAVMTDNVVLPEGGVTATGTVTIPYKKLVDKSMADQDTPAYVEYALNINPNASNLVADSGTLEVVDIMSSGMSLSTNHANFFKVYDVKDADGNDVAGLLDENEKVIASVAQTGTDITDQCTIENITGQELDGMTDDEKGKPAYKITVPDGKHVVVLYWAIFEGVEDEKVTLSNKASFFYKNAIQSGDSGKSEESIVAKASSAGMFTGPYFYVKKTDQWGNIVSGVTYELYEVTVDASGNETDRAKIMEQTTGDEGTVYFGHRSNDSYDPLSKTTLYCLVETVAPAGYAIDSKPYYFAFSRSVAHPADVNLHYFITGGTYSFTNESTPATYSVPVKKTINGNTIASDTEFSFTLKQSSDGTVYTDKKYATAIPEAGIQATIAGSGETTFDKLYFTKAGTYTFTMTEDALTTEAANNGYSKDSNTFDVTIVVGTSGRDLVIESATFDSADPSVAGGDLSTSVPTFNNTLNLTGTITLNAKKVVENRAKAVQAGEFAFTVSAGGEVIAEKNDDGTTKIGEDGKPVKKLFYTKAGGDIEFNIDIDQDDIGTKIYIISEVEGEDPTIKYTTDRVRVKVTIAEVGNGKVAATKYEYLTDPAEFTNEYEAEGSLTLHGKKELTSSLGSMTVSADEFEFEVKEGNTVVATGTTEKGGNIKFTDITYFASDIGEHTYVISEVKGDEPYVKYTADPVTVKVTVRDTSNDADGVAGKLTATAEYPKNADGSDATEAKFVNEC
jgi:pilin isopeptide linkage protein